MTARIIVTTVYEFEGEDPDEFNEAMLAAEEGARSVAEEVVHEFDQIASEQAWGGRLKLKDVEATG